MSLKKVADELRKIDLLRLTEEQVLITKEELLDLNTDEQLFLKGVDSKGESLGTYTAFTKRAKQAKNQPSNRVTLKDEGDFYRGFTLEGKRFPFSIDSTDEKRDKLVDKYGEDIFGITPDNTSKYAKETLLPNLQDALNEELKKAFRVLRGS